MSRARALLLALGLWLLVAAPAMAQEAQQKGFVPAESLAHQEVPTQTLIYAAYAFVWASVLVYVVILWRRIARVERELLEVNRKLGKP